MQWVAANARKRSVAVGNGAREKLNHLQGRLAKATQSEKQEIVRKLREMTPGSEVLISNWGLEEADR